MTVDKYTTPLRKLALHEVNALREKCKCIRNFSIVEIDMSVSETLQQLSSESQNEGEPHLGLLLQHQLFLS